MKKTAIITGASSGLGEEFIKQINSNKKERNNIDEIWAVARRKERLDALKEISAIPVRPVSMDLTEEENIQRLEDMLTEEKPDLRLLINAAGFGKIGRYDEIPRRQADRMIDLNCRAAVDVTQICLPYMGRGARIMEICSTAGFQPFPYLSVYAASKAFLYRYSRALRQELFGRGIKVTAVCPYWVKDTEFIPVARDTDNDGKNEKTDAVQGTGKAAAGPAAGSRHIKGFPLASRKKNVVRWALHDSRLGLPVSTPGPVCLVHRIAAKFIPSEAMMGIWQAIRFL